MVPLIINSLSINIFADVSIIFNLRYEDKICLIRIRNVRCVLRNDYLLNYKENIKIFAYTNYILAFTLLDAMLGVHVEGRE